MISHPVMDNDVKHTADFYRLVAWVHARRKQIAWISAAVAAVAIVVGLFIWYKNYKETAAAETLSQLKSPFSTQAPTADSAAPYIKLANDYPGTGAAGRALLIAGGILFDAGKFKEAQDQFE